MKPSRTLALLASLAFAVVFPLAAQAHTHLKASTPAEGSVLATPPTSIVLEFSGPARITALTVQKDGDTAAPQKIEPLPTEAKAELMVPAPKLAAGKYSVNWRIVSADNHVMSGTLHFTVGTPAASTGTAPAKN